MVCRLRWVIGKSGIRRSLLLLLFLLVVGFVFLLYLLLFLQGDLGDTHFGHPHDDRILGPFVEVLEAFDTLCTGHDVPRLDRAGTYFEAFI